MAKPSTVSASVSISGKTLTINQSGNYVIENLGSGKTKFSLEDSPTAMLKTSAVESITNIVLVAAAAGATFSIAPGTVLNFKDTFVEAQAGKPFEDTSNLDALIGSVIATQGVDYLMDHLTINGSVRDAFQVVWDYLDDQYVAGANYYDLPLNESFIRLGIAYAEYLDAGGEPLTDVTAKYAADDDADNLPQRSQSMHDNLLGNIAKVAIEGRDFPDDLEAELLAAVPPGYLERGVFSGDQSSIGSPAHDSARAFDYDRGWERDDYVDATLDGVVDPLASRDTNPVDGVDEQMLYGNGNTIDDWNLVRHEGAGIELGLKVKHRGGDEYSESFIDADGIAHYVVATGDDPTNSNRAEWNFDFSATDFSADDNYKFVLELDVDPSAAVNWQTIYSSDVPLDSQTGDGSLLQNSFNMAFVDFNPGVPGTQHYGFGDAEFHVRLTAFEVGDTNSNDIPGEPVLTHEIIIQVGTGNYDPAADMFFG